MSADSLARERVTVHVENVGGITETDVTFSPGVTVLAGRNATNRTSFLRAIMAALGSDDVAIKGDAEEGIVELSTDEETYTRRLVDHGEGVVTDGDPYLEDTTLADLFAFLLRSNEARRTVAGNEDLRELIMEPVDTEELQSAIDRLVEEREEIERELEAIDERKSELPSLESERSRLESEIESKRERLAETESELESRDADVEAMRREKADLEESLERLQEKRTALEDVRYDLETEQETLADLEAEKRELEGELADLPEAPVGDLDEIESDVDRLRSRKQSLESEINELQSIIQFNEGMLDDVDQEVLAALASDPDDDRSVTDKLLADDSVRCWTCGTAVDTDQIEGTVERLRELSQSKFSDVQELTDELDELKAKRRELRQQNQRRETVERRLRRIESEIEESEATIERLRERREELTDEIETIEADVETEDEDEAYAEVLDLHKTANQLEYEIGSLESDLDRVTDEITAIERRLDERDDLAARREEITDEIEDHRTKIERIEREAIEGFNEHMDTVLELLGYENLERIWLERRERDVRRGRRTDTETVFELHVVRSTDAGATYEDTIDHLSESEREVTGLIFALAGYLAHEVYEEVPFMLLDSLEAIDSDRIATLVEYLADYSEYLVVALLPEDAAALDEYEQVTEI